MTDRTDIFQVFAARSKEGEFPCSWSRTDYLASFDAILEELLQMDADGLIRCLLRHQNDVVTAQLSKAGMAAMRESQRATKPGSS